MPKTIYFVEDPKISKELWKEGEQNGYEFRLVSEMKPGEIEEADEYKGAVPDWYKKPKTAKKRKAE